MQPVAAGGLLYSLLHLGGFAGDLAWYSDRVSGRVLELGCGDGRVAASLCLGERSPSVLQRATGAGVGGDARSLAEPAVTAYVGVEMRGEFAERARSRLAVYGGEALVHEGDFLEPLPPPLSEAPFDAVVVSANTLFCTPRHAALLERCAAHLSPGGLLCLDVYNAMPWHEEGEAEEEEDEAAARAYEADGSGHGADDGGSDELVRVTDEDGVQWRVFEQEPQVDVSSQTIVCSYDFESSGGGRLSESLTHHYATPEQLVRLLDGAGFDIEELHGGFGSERFDAEESEHLVVAARRRGAPSD